jgi:quercetin dioxygenase-like cupin family protein
MSSFFRLLRNAVPALALIVVAVPSQAQKGGALKWGPAPAVFPHGAKMAVVSGDPSKSGSFTVQLSLPGGYRIPPHWHPTDENLTVKQGSVLLGMGDTLSAATMKKMTLLKPGQSAVAKANMHHYAATRGHALVEVTAQGPFAMTYVNAADDPQQQAAKKGKGAK